MVSEDDLDLHALGRRAKVLDGHEGRHPRPGPGQGSVWPGLVVQDADLDDPVRDLGVGSLRGEAQHREKREETQNAHGGHSFDRLKPACFDQTRRLLNRPLLGRLTTPPEDRPADGRPAGNRSRSAAQAAVSPLRGP